MAAHWLNSLVQRGALGPFYCEGHEVLRRIFVTVRDRHWQEIAPTEWEAAIDESRRTVSMAARHISELVDFEWHGTLQVSEDSRTLQFAFAGTVRRDMEICRLGLIVLHPLESLIGSRLTAKGLQGSERITVAGQIHPQPIVDGVPDSLLEPFSELRIDREDFGGLALFFAGDQFELEDQRNWGDASFKTYCTPLRLGVPRRVKAGTAVAHRVEVEFEPAPHIVRASGAAASQTIQPATPLPELGREWRGSQSLDHLDHEDRTWQHIHVDATDAVAAAALPRLLESVTAPSIQLALSIGPGETLPAELLGRLADYPARIARLLISGPGTSPPDRPTIERCRQAAAGVSHSLPVWAATKGYFVEFNRAVPFDLPVDGIAFPLTATVHSDDVATVNENVATIRDIADTAASLSGAAPLALVPLAVHYPPSAARPLPQSLIASWLAATLEHARLAGVASITLGEDVIRALGPSSYLRQLIGTAGFLWPRGEARW